MSTKAQMKKYHISEIKPLDLFFKCRYVQIKYVYKKANEKDYI